MFSIIISHILIHGKAIKKYNKYIELNLLYILSMWHVSSFGVISGLVGSKKNRYSNLLYLWIIVVFYSLVFYVKYNIKYLKPPVLNDIIKANIFPVIYKYYWYFTAYFGIYPFLSIIKSGMAILSHIEVKKSIYFMIGIFIIWNFYNRDTFLLNSGQSSFCILIFYVFGSYFDKYIFYREHNTFIKIIICIICSIIYLFLSLITYKINIQKSFFKSHSKIKNFFQIHVNSFPIVFQTFSIIIFIAQIKFNIYSTKIITFLGPLTFDIYLIHENLYIRRYYMTNILNQYSSNLNLLLVLLLIFEKGFIIFIICVFFAYIRSIIFRIFQIRYICIYLEEMVTKLIYYLI